MEIQKALGYALGANQVFRPERFQPDQAVAIFGVLAELGQIPFDESFVRHTVLEGLASREDGTVSAVDIQVLAWVIAGLPDRQRAFSRESVKMSGGVEGLLERYLQKSLAAIPHLQEPATKVLLALIDLNQDARAGALTINDISDRLNRSVPQKIFHDALDWLTDSRVRGFFLGVGRPERIAGFLDDDFGRVLLFGLHDVLIFCFVWDRIFVEGGDLQAGDETLTTEPGVPTTFTVVCEPLLAGAGTSLGGRGWLPLALSGL